MLKAIKRNDSPKLKTRKGGYGKYTKKKEKKKRRKRFKAKTRKGGLNHITKKKVQVENLRGRSRTTKVD